MTYVMSDIHGEYEKYMEMLQKINFSSKDVLYILGDIVDRGKEPVKILLDMMNRPNVLATMGNHDMMAKLILEKLSVDITSENCETQINAEIISDMLDWMKDGGSTTMAAFKAVPNETRKALLAYINDFPMVEFAEIKDKTFIMVHAGLGNWRKGKKLREYTTEELIASRPNPGCNYFDDEHIYVICGHTPTRNICGEDRIYQKNNTIYIDCGAVWGGKLGCLCLDTFEEFYV